MGRIILWHNFLGEGLLPCASRDRELNTTVRRSCCSSHAGLETCFSLECNVLCVPYWLISHRLDPSISVRRKLRWDSALVGKDQCASFLIAQEDACFCHACLCVRQELLRLYPSAGFTRTCMEDIHLADGMTLPTDTDVFLFPYLIHRHPSNFERGEEFIPERWLPNQRALDNREGKYL